MTTESDDLSSKTWQRAVDSINKVSIFMIKYRGYTNDYNVNLYYQQGYMDGAVGGQEATFQSSFDKGYTLGYSSGLELGIREALHR